jgi:hypothetical protein
LWRCEHCSNCIGKCWNTSIVQYTQYVSTSCTRCPMISMGVRDNAVPCVPTTAESDDSAAEQLFYCLAFILVHGTAVSMTPLCNQLCRISSRIQSCIRKGFNPCIRGPGEATRGRKIRVRAPLTNLQNLLHCRTHWMQVLPKKLQSFTPPHTS